MPRNITMTKKAREFMAYAYQTLNIESVG